MERPITLILKGRNGNISIPHVMALLEPCLVYHYTDAAGLIGIVNGGTLFASSPDSLNDASELQYGRRLLVEAWKRKRATTEDALAARVDHSVETLLAPTSGHTDSLYITSASRQPDLLNQWQHYAKKDGFSLGLNTAQELDIRDRTGSIPPLFAIEAPRGFPFPAGWMTVIYDEQRQERMVSEMLDGLVQALADDADAGQKSFLLALVLLCRLKHPSFAAEEEVRHVTYAPPRYAGPLFRPSRFGVTPYIQLSSASAPVSFAQEKPLLSPRLPIEAVVCGPAPASERASMTTNVTRLMQARGYRVEVSASELPFRY